MAATSGIAAPTTIFSNATPKPVDGTNGNGFGQDTFLKLLVTQLRFQDPSEPVDNQQFLGQMAQFTSLEQMTKLNASISQIAGSNTKSSAVSLLGTEVVIHPTPSAGSTSDKIEDVTGTVTQVRFEGADVKLEVNGKEFLLADVTKVNLPQQVQQLLQQ